MKISVFKSTDIVALRNEKGSYNLLYKPPLVPQIVALRNEKGSYNNSADNPKFDGIVALRNEKGSYNPVHPRESR